MFFGVLTRCKDEYYIKEFCDYYINQGADIVYIIDDNSNDKTIYDNLDKNKVKVIYSRNVKNWLVIHKIYCKIKYFVKWLAYIDVDEFITTKKNLNNTIRDELETTFKDVDCIKIPWVMMACNKRENNPKSVLLENTYRMDHDKKHPNGIGKFACNYYKIFVKCILKTKKYKSIIDHKPKKPNYKTIIMDSINKNEQELDGWYYNLRESDIKNGYLLCYHYRIISKENCLNKIKNNVWYKNIDIDYLMKLDHPEIIDETIKNKVLKYKKLDNYDEFEN